MRIPKRELFLSNRWANGGGDTHLKHTSRSACGLSAATSYWRRNSAGMTSVRAAAANVSSGAVSSTVAFDGANRDYYFYTFRGE